MELRNRTLWTFYWRGEPLTLRLDLLEGKGGHDEQGWSHWKLVFVNGSHGLPDHLSLQKDQIIEALKEDLIATKGQASTRPTTPAITSH